MNNIPTILKRTLLVVAAIAMVALVLTKHVEATAIKQASVNTINCTGIIYRECHLRLGPSITAQTDYSSLLQTIDTLDSNDTLYIHLSGYGGRVSSMMQIISAVKNSGAHTVSIVEGNVYSAHGIIALSSDNIVIAKGAVVMFHSIQVTSPPYRTMPLGKFIKIVCPARDDSDREQERSNNCTLAGNIMLHTQNQMFSDMGFVLTKEEIKAIKNGKEMFLTSQELTKRSDRVKLIGHK